MNMPHPLDRPYQNEAYLRIASSKKKFVIAKLKTGLGKTALAAQLACDGKKVMSCVMTKALQYQYVESYGFTELFGKANYECYEYGQSSNGFYQTTADLCDIPTSYKNRCMNNCPYPCAREKFINARAGVTNYHKFISDRSVVNTSDFSPGFDSDILVFDEMHELSDFVVDKSGVVFKWGDKYLKQYSAPCDPIDTDEMDLPFPIAIERAIGIAREWLKGLLWALKTSKPTHPSRGGNVSLWRWHKRTLNKVDILIENIKTASNCWFIHSDEEGITIRPKTAQFHFKRFFDKAPQIVMMSATVQYKDILSLGIEPDEFEFVNMPNPYPPGDRPVYDLEAPKITAKTSLADCKKHAQIIADVFNQAPDSWNGLVHMPSKKKSEDWGEWLSLYTKRPVWVPERDLSTDEAYDQWREFNRLNDGAIACAWNMMTGIDGKNININICGCVPYPNFGDRFQSERFNYNPGEARVRVANTIEQQMGRNRRGFVEHYGPGAKKFNGIADGKWHRLKSAFDKDFLAAIRKQ